MRWSIVILTIAAVCLSDLFIFTPECIQAGDFLVRPLSVDFESRDVKTESFMCLNGIMDLVSGNIPGLRERNWPWHMTDYGPGMMGYWFGGFFMWIIFIVIIAVAVYFILHISKQKETDTLMSETPLDILKKRYAKGEISKEEFDEIRKNIES